MKLNLNIILILKLRTPIKSIKFDVNNIFVFITFFLLKIQIHKRKTLKRYSEKSQEIKMN